MKNRISTIRKAYFPVTTIRNNDQSLLEFATAINATFDKIKQLEKYPFVDSREISASTENIANNIFKKFGLPIEFTLGYTLIDTGKSNAIFSRNLTDASEELKLCEFARAGILDYHNDDIDRKFGEDEDGYYRVVRRDGFTTKVRLTEEDINSLLLQTDQDEDEDDDEYYN